MRSRKIVEGYTDLGSFVWPLGPSYLIMESRDNGSYWLTVVNGVSSLSSTLPTDPNVITYGRYAGPYLNGSIRLYISGGALAGELVSETPIIGYRSPRVIARNATDFLEITAATTWKVGDAFTYTVL